MFIRKFGQEYRQIAVTDSYQQVHDNYDNFDEHTGLHSAYAMEDFEDAVAKIAANNGTILVEKTVLITDDLTVASNVAIEIVKGGLFSISSGKTLTLNGEVYTNGQAFGTVFTGAGTIECVVKGVFNQIETGEGMLEGGSAQTIFEYSITQNFPLGYRRVIDDRVFKYGKANDSNDLLALFGARCTNFPQEGNTDAVEYAAGTYEITIPMNPNAVNFVAEQVENYWADGYIWVMEWPQVTGAGEMYRIKSSAVAVGLFVTLTLETPLRVTVGASTWITAWPHPLKNVDTNPDVRQSVVCVPLIFVPATKYFWGQTWGPIFMSSGQSPGRLDHERDVYFHPTEQSPGQTGIFPGTDISWDVAANPVPQRAGFILTNTNEWTPAGGGTELGGDQFFMLMISP